MSSPLPAAASRTFLRSLSVEDKYRTVLILGGSYAGLTAARAIMPELPAGWRSVVIDRNAQFTHLYLLPRASVMPEHAHKAFIPIEHNFAPPNAYVQSTLVSLDADRAIVQLADSTEELSIPYSYCLYCLGGTLPAPVDLSGGDGTEATGVARLRQIKDKVDGLPEGGRVLVVGGGALGIQLATDIKELHPGKDVTLLQSRPQLLPRFDAKMHDLILARFQELGIRTVLGERAVLPPDGLNGLDTAPKVIRTTAGTEIPCELVLVCTGQAYQSHHLQGAFSDAVDPATRLVRVLRSMQVADSSGAPVLGGRLFAAGDVADAHGATKAGHSAADQARIAASNILRLVRASEEAGSAPALEQHFPPEPKIKVSLGRTVGVVQSPGRGPTRTDDGMDDLRAAGMWRRLGALPGWDDGAQTSRFGRGGRGRLRGE